MEQSLDIGIANIITNEWLRIERVKQTRECMLEVREHIGEQRRTQEWDLENVKIKGWKRR